VRPRGHSSRYQLKKNDTGAKRGKGKRGGRRGGKLNEKEGRSIDRVSKGRRKGRGCATRSSLLRPSFIQSFFRRLWGSGTKNEKREGTTGGLQKTMWFHQAPVVVGKKKMEGTPATGAKNRKRKKESNKKGGILTEETFAQRTHPRRA